jgi:ABC-2 type transport system permease protein
MLYMVLSILFIGAVVVLEAWPVYMVFMSDIRGIPLSPAVWSGIATSCGLAVFLTLGVFWFSARWSIARLESMEVAL